MRNKSILFFNQADYPFSNIRLHKMGSPIPTKDLPVTSTPSPAPVSGQCDLLTPTQDGGVEGDPQGASSKLNGAKEEDGVANKEWKRFCERQATASANQVSKYQSRFYARLYFLLIIFLSSFTFC